MIDQDDLQNYAKFLRVIENGQFDTQGKAMIPVALLFKWYIELGPKLKKCYEEAESKKIAAKGPEVKPHGKKLSNSGTKKNKK